MDQSPAAPSAIRFYVFPPFTVDVLKRLVLRDGVAISLPPKTFDTLLTLIRRHGEVVDKDALMSSIWGDVVVEENSLVRHISTLRRALDETPEAHRYIVTVPGRGYSFVADVEEVTSIAPRPHATRAPVVASSAWAMAAIVVLTVSIASVLWVSGAWRSDAPPASSTARAIWQLTFGEGVEGEPTWSPDGRKVAYTADTDGNLDIWVRSIDDDTAVRMSHSGADDTEPAWSPDGRFIAFRSERDGGGIFVVPATGGSEKAVSTFGRSPRWSPDGARILFGGGNGTLRTQRLFVTGLDGQTPKAVLDDVLREFIAVRAEWHPDSERVSLWGVHRTFGNTFWSVPLNGDEAIRYDVAPEVAERLKENGPAFLDEDDNPTRFSWTPAGDALLFEGISRGVRNIWKVRVDSQRSRWIDGPERLTTAPAFNGDLALRPDGKALAFVARTERIRVWSFPLDAAGLVNGAGDPLTSAALNSLAPDVSPDGRYLVFKTERGQTEDIRQKALDTQLETVLVRADAANRMLLRWGYDGQGLTYAKQGARGPDAQPAGLELTSMTLGFPETVSSLNRAVDLVFDWSPDGSWLVGSTRLGARYALRRVTLSASGALQTRLLAADAERNLWQARISPNQKWIAYSAMHGDSSRVYLIAAQGGTPVEVVDGRSFNDRPAWSADGRLLYFLSNRGGRFNVWARHINPQGGQPIGEAFQVTHLDRATYSIPRRVKELALVVKQNRLVIPVADVSSSIWVLEGVDR